MLERHHSTNIGVNLFYGFREYGILQADCGLTTSERRTDDGRPQHATITTLSVFGKCCR